MSIRVLGLAAAAALALGAFAGSPASAAAIAPTAPSANTADVAPLATPVSYHWRNHSHYPRFGHRYPRRHHFGHFPRFGFSLHLGNPYAYGSCWRQHYVWTAWGYQLQRVWVCGRW